MDTLADAQENDALPNTTNGIQEPKRMILRTRNHLSPNSKPTNVEEQIIQKRGRRVFTKPTPCTPPPSRKRRADDSTVDLPQPNESPFTKCLRGLLSPKRGVDPTPSHRPSVSSSSSRLLSSSNDLPSKKFYYSPNPPYQLRSMDVSIRSSTGNSSSVEFNDSGIGLSPEISLSDTTNNSDCSTNIDISISSSSKTTNTKKSDNISSKISTKTSTTARRINGARRRFRF